MGRFKIKRSGFQDRRFESYVRREAGKLGLQVDFKKCSPLNFKDCGECDLREFCKIGGWELECKGSC